MKTFSDKTVIENKKKKRMVPSKKTPMVQSFFYWKWSKDMRLKNFNMKKINLKEVEKNYTSQDILMKLGELYSFESGIYGYGNIWTKLERIVENIIIEELDKIDCIQVEFPKLQPKKIWEQSGRWNLYTEENDIMFHLENNLGEYGLAPTAEECATIFGANRLPSYKNLPAIYYQIGEKFRKEKRARGYLFRPRTFVMMDAYSFDKTEEDMKQTYQKMNEVYQKIFNRLGIDIITTVSNNGTMGGKVSEEFQALTELGEDIILYDENKRMGINKEVLTLENEEEYFRKLGFKELSSLKEHPAIELGNNFQLGTKYSESMELYYQDENGKKQPYYMGCYGIGLGRIIATILENSLVKEQEQIKGISLPISLAPYKIQIVYLEEQKELAEKLYSDLEEANIKTILDDRDRYSFGNKIKDAYLLGCPFLVIIGNHTTLEEVEVEETKTGRKKMVKIVDLLKKEEMENSYGILELEKRK